MPETLAVHLNRDRLHSIEAPDSFETADSFVVEIENHGEAAHAHLRLDDGLAEIASLPTGNHYVRTGTVERVPISVRDPGPLTGTLTVATAYGSETHNIEVAVEPAAGKQAVEIDESLIEGSNSTTTRSSGTVSATTSASGTSRPTSSGSSSSSTSLSPRSTTARSGTGRSSGLETPGLLAGTALVILVGIGLLFLDGPAMFVGTIAVLGGLVVAGYLLLY